MSVYNRYYFAIFKKLSHEIQVRFVYIHRPKGTDFLLPVIDTHAPKNKTWNNM